MSATEQAYLPCPTDTASIMEALGAAHAHVEQFVWRVRKVTEHELDGVSGEWPPVTYETVGVVATIVDDLGARLNEIAAFRDELSTSIGSLNAIRERNES